MADLEDIQDGILARLHAGEPVERDAILAEHPEHAEALRQSFVVIDLVESSPAPDEPEHARLGEFRILSELGRGGMGVVYQAEQASLNRRVALKVLPPALRNDRRILARFKREAEAAGRLRHPNIVPVFSCGEAGGAPFFAMELVEGVSLAQLIDRRRCGEDDRDPDAYRRWAIDLVARIADALAYAHGRGILHRDVKPANIMVEPNGTPRLTDFGLALDLEASSLTVAGEVFGSPLYMSPEQAFRREQPLDARTDVYSMGVTLYEVLTLRLPYDGATNTEVLTALSAGKIVPPRRADPDLPEPLERVLLHALQRDPDDRYKSAEEFALDLRSLLDDRPVAAPRPRRKMPRTVILALLLALLGTLVAEFRWPAELDPEPDPNPPPATRDLALLLAGTHPDGEAVMRRWFHPNRRTRNVIARNAPAHCTYEFRYRLTQKAPAGTYLVMTPAVSVGADDWRQEQPSYDLLRGGGSVPTGRHYSRTLDLRPLLHDTLQKKGFFMGHRLTIRIAQAPQGWEELPPEERPPLTGGTSCTWNWEPTAVFVYDEYPADYPRLVSDPALDPEMRRAFTPDQVELTKVGKESFGLRWRIPSQGGGPFPLASVVEILHGDVAVARSTWTRAPGTRCEGTTVVEETFKLTGEDADAEREFLLDLQALRLESVHLVARPSRAAALEEPDFESYWGQTLDVTVPFAGLKFGGRTSRVPGQR